MNPSLVPTIYGLHSLIFVMLLIAATSYGKNVWSNELCKGSRADCSSQIPEAFKGSCVVMPTSECKNFSFTSWTRWPPVYSKNQEDVPFSVLIEPYSWSYQKYETAHPALNITLQTGEDSDINGFILLVTDIDGNYNSCRIFDFRNARVSYHKQVSLFYDCYHSLDSNGIFHYIITVRSLPQNKELQYMINILSADKNESKDICNWKSFLMVHMGGLFHQTVQIKFKPAPDRFNVTKYNVSLMTKEGVAKYSKTVEHGNGSKSMILTSFENVYPDNYTVVLVPLIDSNSTNCSRTLSHPFNIYDVSNKLSLYIYFLIPAVGLLIMIILLLIVYYLHKPGIIMKRPKVLILYSYDCKYHKNVISRFATFLEKQCYVDVLVDIHNVANKDVDLWLLEKFNEADIIVVVISQGVFHKFEKNNQPPMKEGLIWGDIFCAAKTLLVKAGLRDNKKIIKVYFDYSGAKHIPYHLQLQGETYHLMKRLNLFLCSLHNQDSKLRFLKVYPQMPGYDFLATPEGLMLNEALQVMIQFQKNEPNWLLNAIYRTDSGE